MPLSKTNAWRAGSFLEDLDGEALVFIEKDGERTAFEVEKLIGRENELYWLREKKGSPNRNTQGKVTTTPLQRMRTACKKTPRRRGGPNNWMR